MGDKCEYLYIGGMRVPMENVLITYVPYNRVSAMTQSFRVAAKSPGKDRGEPPYILTIKELKKLLKHNHNSTMVARVYDPKLLIHDYIQPGKYVGELFKFNPSKAQGRAGRRHAAKEGRSDVWAQFESDEFVAGFLAKGVSYGASEGLDEINTSQMDWLARTPAGRTVLDSIADSTVPSLIDVKLTLAAAAANMATIVPLSSKITEAFSKLAPMAAALGFGSETPAPPYDDEDYEDDEVDPLDIHLYDYYESGRLLAPDADNSALADLNAKIVDFDDSQDLEWEELYTGQRQRLLDLAQGRAWAQDAHSTSGVLRGLNGFIEHAGSMGGTGITHAEPSTVDADLADIRPWLEANPDPEVQIAAITRLAEQYGDADSDDFLGVHEIIETLSKSASSVQVRQTADKICKSLWIGHQNWLGDERRDGTWYDEDEEDADFAEMNLEHIERAERELTAKLKRDPTPEEVVDECTVMLEAQWQALDEARRIEEHHDFLSDLDEEINSVVGPQERLRYSDYNIPEQAGDKDAEIHDKSQKSGASSSARVLAAIAYIQLDSEVEVASFKKSLETARAEDAKAVEKESIEIDKKFKEKSDEKAKLSAESRKKERDTELSEALKLGNDEIANIRRDYANVHYGANSALRTADENQKKRKIELVKSEFRARHESINEKHDALDSAALAQEAKSDAHIAKLMEITRAADSADIEKRDIEVDKVLQEFLDQKKDEKAKLSAESRKKKET